MLPCPHWLCSPSQSLAEATCLKKEARSGAQFVAALLVLLPSHCPVGAGREEGAVRGDWNTHINEQDLSTGLG